MSKQGSTDSITTITQYHQLRLRVMSSPPGAPPAEELKKLQETETCLDFLRATADGKPDERRQWQRYTFEKIFNLQRAQSGSTPVYGVTRNISLGGLFVEADVDLKLGDLVQITIIDQGSDLHHRCWGRVQWVHYPSENDVADSGDEGPLGIGIKFLTSPDMDITVD